MSDHAWMELCQVSRPGLHELEAKALDAVLLHCPKSLHPEVTSLVLQALPSDSSSDSNTNKHIAYLNPLIYDFVSNAAAISVQESVESMSEGVMAVSIMPLGNDAEPKSQQEWAMTRIQKVESLPSCSTVSITCIFRQDSRGAQLSVLKRQLCLALEGRLIRMNSLLALPTLVSGTCLVTVMGIVSRDNKELQDMVYRVESSKNFGLDVTITEDLEVPDDPTLSEWEQTCPGYNQMLDNLLFLSQLKGVAAPSGVLLTGCAGVGKSRLASCLAYHVSKAHNMHVHWTSAQDLLAKASWATESDMLDLLIPKTIDKRPLVVIDDLQILQNDSSEGNSFTDPEILLVHNSVLQALAQLSSWTTTPFILGIAHSSTLLPKELVRIGRMEKVMQMDPPSQVQREDILECILQDVEDKEKRHKWAEALAGQTAGCVAFDLCQMYADAWTRAQSSPDNGQITWNDLREAAFACVPSQLAQLDVTKTVAYPNETDGPPDPLRIHEWSWQSFGGYDEVKKRLYRTVVVPWCRYMIDTAGRSSNDEKVQISKSWITPPSGVLFHGPSGVGKTLAASCLASSLGLHVVKVRASDVLDQWLGGSEAVIRSLFARARAASPCILFFDEIDAIATNREDDGSSVDVSSRILTTFLNEMDGISSGGDTRSNILVVACTNRLETLDAALLRPGRLDEHVLLRMPAASDVADMLQLHLSKVPRSDDVNVIELAELLVELGASGADVEGMCRDTCCCVIREATHLTQDLVVTQNDFLKILREWKGQRVHN